jgi:SAM-dependent methyltransferase
MESALPDQLTLHIQKHLKLQKEKGYTIDRTALEYIHSLEGLHFMFEHIRKLGTPTVCDLGAGVGEAVTQLANTDIGKGLDFFATVLDPSAVVDPKRVLPKRVRNPIKPTFVEGLFETFQLAEPMGGFISCAGLCYAVDIGMALKNIDRNLMPGGVIKADFPLEGINTHGMHSSEKFISTWSQMRYGVAAMTTDNDLAVVIAVKQGSDDTAEKLLNLDHNLKDYSIRLLEYS